MQDLNSDDLTFWQNVDCYIDARQSLMIFYSNDFKEKILIDGNNDLRKKLSQNFEETKNLTLIMIFFRSIENLCYSIITHCRLESIKDVTIFDRIKNDKINRFIEGFAERKIPKFDKKYWNVDLIERVTSFEDYIYDAILLDRKIRLNLISEKMRENKLSIPEFISVCCKFYRDHKDFYNKYKHGNRVYLENISLEIENKDSTFEKIFQNTMHHYFTEKDGFMILKYFSIKNEDLLICTINCCMISEFIRSGKIGEKERNINLEIPFVDMGEHACLKISQQ